MYIIRNYIYIYIYVYICIIIISVLCCTVGWAGYAYVLTYIRTYIHT